MSLLKINDLFVSYGKAVILNGVNLSLEKGEAVAIVGPNGAGKTTLLKTISGLIRGRGSIEFNNQRIDSLPSHEIVKRKIVLCPERRRLFPEMTTRRNLEMGAYLRKDKKEVIEDMENIFNLFPSLKRRMNNLAGTMSGGEQQILAVARALMSQPQLLMLDEPSFGLAPLVKKIIVETMKEIKKKQITILLSEQDTYLAFDLADTVYVLENGVISFQGTPKALMNNQYIKEAYLGLA